MGYLSIYWVFIDLLGGLIPPHKPSGMTAAAAARHLLCQASASDKKVDSLSATQKTMLSVQNDMAQEAANLRKDLDKVCVCVGGGAHKAGRAR